MSMIAIPVLKDNYVWLIPCRDRRVIVVDPGESEPVLSYLSAHQLKLAGILLTHHHWDHSGGVEAMLQEGDVPVVGSVDSSIQSVNQPMTNGDRFVLAGREFFVMSAPGHTLDHLLYRTEDALFTGDALFSGGCGRVFEGSMAQMYQSLMQIRDLPDDCQLYCGHEYTLNNLAFAQTILPQDLAIQSHIAYCHQQRQAGMPSMPITLEQEKQINLFLRCDDPLVVSAVSEHCDNQLKTPMEVFAQLRHMKDNF